jgi:hypothetical protein
MNREVAFYWGGASVMLVALSPLAPRLASGLWSCAFKSVTGLPCPTCGTVRAALALARLDLVGALTHYPLPTLGWIAFLGGGVVAFLLAASGRRFPAIPNRLPAWAKVALVVAVLLNWAYSIGTGV